ncbi:MAG: hypothetical protein LUG96_13260 [Tannerellaceae bacterium]|nr:hypothetical protein [Tannerellaceae bacterium]
MKKSLKSLKPVKGMNENALAKLVGGAQNQDWSFTKSMMNTEASTELTVAGDDKDSDA